MQSRVSGVTINEFFSFGQGNGDSELSLGDDDRVAVPFLSTFLFYGKAYTSFLVRYAWTWAVNDNFSLYSILQLAVEQTHMNRSTQMD